MKWILNVFTFFTTLNTVVNMDTVYENIQCVPVCFERVFSTRSVYSDNVNHVGYFIPWIHLFLPIPLYFPQHSPMFAFAVFFSHRMFIWVVSM